MEEKERNEKNDRLNSVVRKLAESQNIFSDKKKYNDYYTKLCGIYRVTGSANFMHSQHEIFTVLAELDASGKSLEILGQNMAELYKYSESKTDSTMKDSLFHLYDNINLDIARINYIKAVDRRLDSTGKDLMCEIENTRESAGQVKIITDELVDKVESMSGKVNNAYSEFVSILGIFSAIVLVFFGGTSIFGSIISNMRGTYIYKCIIMCLLTGVIIFDIIFMFIYFMAKLISKSIATTEESGFWQPIGARFRERYPLVFYTNYLVFWSIYISAAIWIWYVMKIEYHNDILILLNTFMNTGNYRSIIVFLLIYILIVFDLGFLIAYVISKMTDLNIGRTITLKHSNIYDCFQNGQDYCVTKNYDEESMVIFAKRRKALFYMSALNFFSGIYTDIYNLFKRIFFRYPYLPIINSALFFAVIIIIDFNKFNKLC